MFQDGGDDGGSWREPDPLSGVPSWVFEVDGVPAVARGGVVGVVESDALITPWDLLDREVVDFVEPTALIAGELARKAPGADLAYLLERGTLADADDYAVVEAVAGWQRLAAWAAAGAAGAAAELADRPSMNPNWPESAGKVSELNVAGDELAIRLSCSRQAARALVRDGRAFRGPLTPTGDALWRGEIDHARARVLVRALADVPVPLALDVQDVVLSAAPGRTPGQVERDVARALITADPAGAEIRCQVAVRGRRLNRPKFLPDGMAGLWAVLPAADAVRLDAGIDTLAQSARTAGDLRTLDQLRADLLVDLTLGRLSPTETCQSPATDGAGRGGAVRDGAVRAGDVGRASAPRRVGARSQIRVTVPMSSLQGTGGEPGELAGYGPITAATAQDLATDGVWTRLVTDPLTGAVLDVGRTRYRPPAALAEHVRARDRYCARPGCSVRAEACDLDHTIEDRDHGDTKDTNLGPLCPRDHQIKTDAGFALSQIGPGVFEWCTPTGHRYRVTPGADLPTEQLPRALGPPPF